MSTKNVEIENTLWSCFYEVMAVNAIADKEEQRKLWKYKPFAGLSDRVA